MGSTNRPRKGSRRTSFWDLGPAALPAPGLQRRPWPRLPDGPSRLPSPAPRPPPPASRASCLIRTWVESRPCHFRTEEPLVALHSSQGGEQLPGPSLPPLADLRPSRPVAPGCWGTGWLCPSSKAPERPSLPDLPIPAPRSPPWARRSPQTPPMPRAPPHCAHMLHCSLVPCSDSISHWPVTPFRMTSILIPVSWSLACLPGM